MVLTCCPFKCEPLRVASCRSRYARTTMGSPSPSQLWHHTLRMLSLFSTRAWGVPLASYLVWSDFDWVDGMWSLRTHVHICMFRAWQKHLLLTASVCHPLCFASLQNVMFWFYKVFNLHCRLLYSHILYLFKLNDLIPVQVRTRSPIPARPPMVMGWAPLATAKRVISTSPLVIKAALALLPKPNPSDMPQAMANTFFNAPPNSTPTVNNNDEWEGWSFKR